MSKDNAKQEDDIQILTPEEEQISKLSGDALGVGSKSYRQMSLETYVVLIVIALVILVLTNLLLLTQSSGLIQDNMLNPAYAMQSHEAKVGEMVFLLLMFVGFFFSYKYVMSSIEKSGWIYVFIITSGFGLGALVGVIALTLGFNVGTGIVGGLFGIYFAYKTLRSKGFAPF